MKSMLQSTQSEPCTTASWAKDHTCWTKDHTNEGLISPVRHRHLPKLTVSPSNRQTHIIASQTPPARLRKLCPPPIIVPISKTPPPRLRKLQPLHNSSKRQLRTACFKGIRTKSGAFTRSAEVPHDGKIDKNCNAVQTTKLHFRGPLILEAKGNDRQLF